MALLRTKLSVFVTLITTNNFILKSRFCQAHTLELGTKTAYDWVSGNKHVNTQADNECRKSQILHNSRTCQPIHINAVYRHGTRFPSEQYLKTHKQFFYKIQHAKPNRDFTAYTTTFTEESTQQITEKGTKEMLQLGARSGQHFCDMLTTSGPTRIRYVSSSKLRSVDSARNHRKGLFASLGWDQLDSNQNINADIQLNDQAMRFFKMCPKYQKHLDTHRSGVPVYMQEHLKFMNGPEISYVTKSIAKKLKIPQNIITNEEMHAIYYIGSYELVVNNNSKIIDLFDADHLSILAYLDDLKQYWKKSYGFKINYEITCGLLKEVYNGFVNVIMQYRHNQAYDTAVFQFGHAETIIPIHAAFGLDRDAIPLKGDNYASHSSRSFRTGKIAPFAGNIAFILHKCDSPTDSPTSNNPYISPVADHNNFFIQTVVNERVITLADCPELCPFAKWTSQIQYLLDLDFDTYCEVDSQDRTEL